MAQQKRFEQLDISSQQMKDETVDISGPKFFDTKYVIPDHQLETESI